MDSRRAVPHPKRHPGSLLSAPVLVLPFLLASASRAQDYDVHSSKLPETPWAALHHHTRLASSTPGLTAYQGGREFDERPHGKAPEEVEEVTGDAEASPGRTVKPAAATGGGPLKPGQNSDPVLHADSKRLESRLKQSDASHSMEGRQGKQGGPGVLVSPPPHKAAVVLNPPLASSDAGSSSGLKMGKDGRTTPSLGASASQTASLPDWKPRPGKYLLAFCMNGRLTNQLLCMKTTMKMAQFLNRSLLVPTFGACALRGQLAFAFRWAHIVDWARMRTCLAPRYGVDAVVTVPQFLRLHNTTSVTVARVVCAAHGQGVCFGYGLARDEVLRLHAGSLLLPGLKAVKEVPLFPNHRYKLHKPSPQAVWEALRPFDNEEVLCLGELFNFGMSEYPPAPAVSGEGCVNLWQPHRAIVRFVDGVISSRLGGRYLAFHFRRDDFYGYVANSKPGTPGLENKYPSANRAAVLVRERMKKLGLRTLFIATDARPLELAVFRAIVSAPAADASGTGNFSVATVLSLREILIFRNKIEDQTEVADDLWSEGASALTSNPEYRGVIMALMDKYLCVKATHFIQSLGSTFSMDILNMRREEFPFMFGLGRKDSAKYNSRLP